MKVFFPEKTSLGIELGSTRIKAVLIGSDHSVLASGAFDWENRLEDGYFTYRLEDAWAGIRAAYAALADDVKEKYGVTLKRVGAIGISGMMHGYLPFDAYFKQLAAFRTWRNTNTERAAAELTELFGFNIPLRWSVAHIYQAMLDSEPHVKSIARLSTLAVYIHYMLTGEFVAGIGEASGMFPIDSAALTYNAEMTDKFDALLKNAGMSYRLTDILPRVLTAGEQAGALTEEGARLIDPTGALESGIPLCPPEGDAGTGMVATNSVAPRTGNVSAGTSIFAMIVLEHGLSRLYTEIDMVTTPSGSPVAMAHSNTCTSDMDAWIRLFGELASAAGAHPSKSELYALFYNKALEGEPDCGGLINYNYFSGEPVARVSGGRPLFVRRSDARLTLANFARAQLFSSIAALKLGMDILFGKENVALDSLLGHGGLFKTPVVGQRLMAGALGVPVSVMDTAGEGGPWGMAVLAAYMLNKSDGETLGDYLSKKVFSAFTSRTEQPVPADTEGFLRFMADYERGLDIERTAVEALI